MTAVMPTMAILIAVVFAHVTSSLTPVNCSNSPNLTVASFGEHVWNCTSPSTSVGGDVLRIVVPSPTANASGLLSVEVRMSTFQQIIVDVGNAVQPQHSVNVSIVLCGAPLLVGSAARNVLNLTDRPLTPAITVTGSSAPSSNLTTAGIGVLVAVIVERDVVLWMRNVSSLVLVESFPAGSSQLLDVAIELHSGSLVDLHDVPHFVLGNAERMRLVFSAFNASIRSTVTTPTAISVVVSVLSLDASGGGSIDVNLTESNVSIMQLSSPNTTSHFLLLQGETVSIDNVTVTFTRCNISIPSLVSNVVKVTGSVASVANIRITSCATNLSCGQSVLSITANRTVRAVDAVVTIHSSSVTVRGSFGALVCVQSFSGSVLLSNTSVTIDGGSALGFAGEGYLVFTQATMNCSANDVTATVRSSNVTVGGNLGAMLYIKSTSGSVLAANATATTDVGAVCFAEQGSIVFALAFTNCSANDVTATVRSSNVTVGGNIGALLYINSSSGVLLSNATATIDGGSTVIFAGEGFLVIALSATNCSASDVTATVWSSKVTVGGNKGAMMYINSINCSVLLSNAIATIDGGSAVCFVGQGYIVYVVAVTNCSPSDVTATVRSSNVTIDGSQGAILYIKSINASVILSNANATIDGGSAVGFVRQGYIVDVLASTFCSASDVQATVRSSNVNIGAMMHIKSTSGSVLLSKAVVTIDGGSAVCFVGQGYIVYVVAVTNCSASDVTATVWSSNVTVGGNLGAMLYIKSSSGSVLLSNAITAIGGGSAVGFVGEGYLVSVSAVTNCSASGVTATVWSSNVTVGGSLGALFFIKSTSGSVLSNANATIDDSIVSFAGQGYLVLALATMNCSASGVTATVWSSNVTVGGNLGAMLYIKSSSGSVLLSNAITAIGGGSAVGFVGEGYLVSVSAVTNCSASVVAATVRSSNVTVGGSLAALMLINSTSGSVLLSNATATINDGSAVVFAGQGYLVLAVAISYSSACGVTAMVRTSIVTMSGSVGALLCMQSCIGSVLLSNATATIDGSAANFGGDGHLVVASASTDCSSSRVAVTVRSSNVTIGGSQGALLYINSSSGVLLCSTTATIDSGSAVGFGGDGYLVLADASLYCNVSDLTATVRSSNVTVGGSHGALLYTKSSVGIALSGAIVTIDNDSAVDFVGEGYLVYALASAYGSASDVAATVRSSKVTVGGSQGMLFYMQSPSGSVLLSSTSATVDDGGAVGFGGDGYLVAASASTDCSSSRVTVTVRSSNVTIGGSQGALLYINSSSGVLLSNAIATIDGGSALGFAGKGYFVLASAVTNSSASDVVASVRSSNVTVSGSFGFLFYTLSRGSVLLSNATATIDGGSTLGFAGDGYLVAASAAASCSSSRVAAVVRSSSVTVGGNLSAILYIMSSSGFLSLHGAIVTIDNDSAVDFVGEGYLVYALASTYCSASDVAATVRSSNVTVGGNVGALLYIKSTSGSVILSNATATIDDRSAVGLAGQGYLVYASASTYGNASTVATTVRSSNVTVGGSQGALLFIDSFTVLLSGAAATIDGGSAVGFVEQGYLVLAAASLNSSVSSIIVAVRSSNVTVGPSFGALLFTKSSSGIVLLDATATIDGGSAVGFVGQGYLVLAIASSNSIASGVTVAVRSSNVTVGGSFGALLYIKSSSRGVLLSDTTAFTDRGSAVGFVGQGYLVLAIASSNSIASGVTVEVRSSNVTGSGSQGALLHIKSSSGAHLFNATATVDGGSALGFAGEGYLVYVLTSTNSSASDVNVTVRSSNVSIGGSQGALLCVQSSSDAFLSNAIATIDGGSTVGFLGEGYLAYASASTYCSTSDVVATVRASKVTVGLLQGSLMYILSLSGSVLQSNTTATIEDGSAVGFAGGGYLVLAEAIGNCSAGVVTATVHSSNVSMGGSLSALFYIVSSRGSVLLANATATIDCAAVGFVGEGYLVVAFGSGSSSDSNVAATVRSSNVTVGGSYGALLYVLSSSGNFLLANTIATIDGGSVVGFVGKGYLILAYARSYYNASDVTATVRTSKVSVGGDLGALLHIKSSSGVFLCSTTATIDNDSAVGFAGEGYLVYVLASMHSSASDVAATVRSSNVTVSGNLGALLNMVSPSGSVHLSNINATIDGGSAVAFDGQGYQVVASATVDSSASGVTATVLSSNMSVSRLQGGLLLFNGSTVLGALPLSTFIIGRVFVVVSDSNVLFHGIGRVVDFSALVTAVPSSSPAVGHVMPSPGPVVRISVVDHSAILVSEIVNSLSAIDFHLLLREATAVVSGRFLFVVEPTTIGSVWISISDSLLLIVSPISRLYLFPPTGGQSNVTFSSSCGLIGWADNVSAAAISHRGVEWTVGVANKFFSGRLSDMPLPFRALRKLDIAGADRVTVTAERCAWGRGSHEFRATDSVSETASSSSSRSLHTRGTTMTLLPSITPSKQQLVVVKRTILIVRGIGSTVLFVAAASSVVSSSVSTVLPGVQIIGQRSALLSQCDAFNAADGGATAVVPPLSDPASNPFGVTIGSLGDELMFAGGSAVSSMLLALVYAVLTVVLAPLLHSPREWLRSVRTGPLAALRLPGSLCAPLALVLQPLTTAAVVLLASSSRSVGSVVFGSVLLVMTLAPLCALLWRVWDGRRQQLLLWEVKRSRHYQLGAALRLVEAMFADRYECVPRSSHGRASHHHFERFGVVAASYASSREWFVGVEVGTAVVSGALSGVASGLDPSLICSAAVVDGFNWTLAALSVALLLIVVCLRPYSSHFGNVQSGLSSLLAAACLTLQSLSPDSSGIAALTWAQSALGFLPLVYLLLPKTAAVGGDGGVTCNGVDITAVPPVELSLLLTETFDAVEGKATLCPRASPRSDASDQVLAAIIETICATRQLL